MCINVLCSAYGQVVWTLSISSPSFEESISPCGTWVQSLKLAAIVLLYQHFGGSTGYGHDEGAGREALDNVFTEIVGAESAIVRAQVF